MKVEIHLDGEMKISSETNVESYALRKWIEENGPSANVSYDWSFTWREGNEKEN